ncbi:MAG: cupin domain-containing protein [candidate division Zixibacteria bacterium]|nr:cupin domain-containing protein [candidate division Zixibacteria bacterium]
MLVRRTADCPEFVAGDGTRLREILHPFRDYQFFGRYSLARAALPVGASSYVHRLGSDEVYFILAGRGLIHVDDETAEVGPGDAIDIPAGSRQWIKNTGEDDLVFLCLVDPAWRIEDEELLKT